MFKISLLPASYRKYLEGKKKKDLILKIALVVLVCMLIIYSGFAIRLLLLQNQYKTVVREKAKIDAEINQLLPYKVAFQTYQSDLEKYNAAKPKDPTALKFLTIIKNNRPDYVKITSVALTDWSGSAICAIEGELVVAQNEPQAMQQLEKYVNTFYGEPYNCKKVRIVDERPHVEESIDGKKEYTFKIYVSFGSDISTDASGSLVTVAPSATEPTTQPPASTAPATEETSSTDTTTIAAADATVA